MAEQPAPYDETRRLQALHSLKILDAHGDTRFERVTRMAKRLFGVSIAIVDVAGRGTDAGSQRRVLDAFEAARPRNADALRASFDVCVVADTRRDPRFKDQTLLFDSRKIRFYAGCAVHASDGSRLGTLCLLDPVPRTLSADDLELLGELGEMVKEEFAALSMATSDVLTKLANRRGFEQIAAHILPIARRLKVPLALVQIDLDGFKEINDSRGHEAGDRLLVAFARQLLKNFRESDVVARCGGDEFCVLMSGAAETEVRQSLLRLETLLLLPAGEPIRFSAGLAVFDAVRHTTLAELLRDADLAMYESKRSKRTSPRR